MPGSGKQSPEVQSQIKELLEAGFDPTTIHRRLKVGRSSIYRMKRCLQQHGTNYVPPEHSKKNGRPKVLTPAQELDVCKWLRDPKNRTRYLDDLVWLIHDRFGIVCSTTTMSKLKRKWLRVIEFEERGVPLDWRTRELLEETHPDIDVLQQSRPMYDVQRQLQEEAQQQQQRQQGVQQGPGAPQVQAPKGEPMEQQHQQMLHANHAHEVLPYPQLPPYDPAPQIDQGLEAQLSLEEQLRQHNVLTSTAAAAAAVEDQQHMQDQKHL